MARGKVIPEVEEYPSGSSIIVKRIQNVTQGKDRGVSWQVIIPAKVSRRGRIRKQFADRDEAKLFAERALKGIRREGEGYFHLTDHERREIGTMVPMLHKRGLSITRAIQFALDRIPEGDKERTLAEVVKELKASKEERQDRGKLSDHTVRTFEYQTNRLIDYIGGAIPVHELALDRIEAFLRSIPGTDRTRKNYYRAANEVLTYACDKGYLSKNPMSEWATEERKNLYGGDEEADLDISIFTVKEVEDFLSYVRTKRPEFLGFVVLAAFCGLRSEEIQKITWDKINLETGYITLDAALAKKRKKRFAEIPANAKEWLLTIPDRAGRVAPSSGNKFRNDFYRLTLAAGWADEDDKSTWKKNGLRHSFGSYKYALTGDSIETARLMGHRQGDATLFEHYAALATKEHGQAYFNITPESVGEIVVPFKEARA